MYGFAISGRDFKKMSGEGEELAAKKAASPLYLGFDFSTQQVNMMSLCILVKDYSLSLSLSR